MHPATEWHFCGVTRAGSRLPLHSLHRQLKRPGVNAGKVGGAGKAAKSYDRAYFDRWYRDPKKRVATAAEVARKVRLAIGVAEALLLRPIRSVLDIGCGEATWRSPLLRWRPRVSYVGVDSSPYVVTRFGRRRGIRLGTFGAISELRLRGPFDLIVCCDVMQYLAAAELRAGLSTVATLLGGVAFLEAYTTADNIEGDHRAWHHRSPAAYRKLFTAARLSGVGMHCWVGDALRGSTSALERSTR